MKKIFALSAIIAVISAPAIAVQKCVALNSRTTCSIATANAGYYEWSLNCITAKTSVVVSGVGVCSHVQGRKMGEVLSSLGSTELGTNTNPNVCIQGDAKYCWCRMVSPAVSQWVHYAVGYPTEAACMYNCTNDCANAIISDDAVTSTAMFSTSTFSD